MADVGGFYAKALEAAAALDLAAARELEGVMEEVALLRVQLRELAEAEGDPELIAKVAETIGKLISIEFRISRKPEDGLSESLVGVLRALSELTGAPA